MQPATHRQPRTFAEATPAARHRLRRGDGRGAADPLRRRAGRGGHGPDLARKLPGRGLWVAANRAAVETGGPQERVRPRRQGQADRAGRPRRPGRRRCWPARVLAGLGLARRAGELTLGFEKALAAVRGRQGGLDHRGRATAPPTAAASCSTPPRRRPQPPRLLGAFDSNELSLALGLGNVIHLAFLAGRGAERWTAGCRATVGLPSAPSRELARGASEPGGRPAAVPVAFGYGTMR